ncbi:MAG: preprotein translocase subunit SecG [Verrucomicrobiota bacterium]|nr:preprotein translocase subunit SecG [Verrucomicrobiota bacterium]
MEILITIVLTVFIVVALLMILIILMQRPKSEGLGAAFGGGMTDNLFGAQTTNVLVKFTGWLAGLFFALTFLLSVLYAHRTAATSGLRQQLMKDSAAASVPGGSPAPAGAVGPPNTVTNPTPGENAPASASNAQPLTPADQAVGMTAPVAPPAGPIASPAIAPSAKPSPKK